MLTNSGIENEIDLVEYLSNAPYGGLCNNMRYLVDFLFGPQDDEEKIIKCTKTDLSMKPDFFLEIDNVKKYVSVKSGMAKLVHEEQIKEFVLFLRSIGVSKETQKTILYYHYGDGTLDGTGTKRYSFEDLTKILAQRIKAANKELNNDYEIMMKFADHCLFDGSKKEYISADCIYHGDIFYGDAITKDDVHSFIKKKTWNGFGGLHIGPLFFRPHARYLDGEIKSEWRRNQVDVTWPNLHDNIVKMANKYNSLSDFRTPE